MPDCGDNSCLYRDRTKPGGMRTNGGCNCDECPACGKYYRRWRPGVPQHHSWCSQPEWIPEHHRNPKDAGPAPRARTCLCDNTKIGNCVCCGAKAGEPCRHGVTKP